MARQELREPLVDGCGDAFVCGATMTAREPTSHWFEPADVLDEYRLLRAAENAAVEPWALLKAVRNPGGRVVDFVYHDINRVAARQQRLRPEDLIGRSVADTLPEVARIGLIEQYARCVDTGHPLVLDDLSYYGRTLDSPELETHRYEMRGVRVGTEFLSLNWRDTNQRYLAGEYALQAREMLRASADGMLDPQVLLEAVRDSSGKIVDFAYRDVNKATCDYLGLAREDLLGRGVVETMPGIEATLLAGYIRCLETGEPLVLNDFSYDNEILLDTRRYDLRATRASPTSITLTWRDVTDRFQSLQRLSASERNYRLLAENSTDVIVHVRDGTVVWVSPSVNGLLGAPDSHWVGRSIREVSPLEDAPALARRMAALASGDTVTDRIRVVSRGGVTHWVSLRAQPFYDDAGHADGFLASLRVIDDEVAAQQELARYRQLIETSSVGTALSNLDGSTAVVNQAMCDLAGFEMDTALQMTWMQVIPEPHLQALLGAIDGLLAGSIDSYRGEHVFIHADGHPRWIDLSLSVMRKPDGQPEYLIFQAVDITPEVRAREELGSARRLLAASADSMLDPQVLLEAVRDPAGTVRDFRYVSANQATLSYLQVTEQELLGRSTLDTLPNLAESGLLGRYAQCLADGEPVVLNDFSYFNHIIDDDRRYDIRATRASPDLLTLTWTDVTDRFKAAQSARAAQTLLHATVDSMLNPQSLLEAVRDREGHVVDFLYRSANRAFCSYRGWEERDIIGQSLLEAQPSLLSSGLFERYVNCLDTGESVVLDNFGIVNAMLGDDRRFDIRVVRAGVDLISLTFGDVTERYEAAQRISASERSYRLLAENSGDMVAHVRDGRFVWVSPSVKDVVGAAPEYWVGRPVREIIPPEEASAFADMVATPGAAGTVKERIRVVAVDGVTHWIDLHARPFQNDDGHQDGFTAALRLVDDEVAAQRDAEDARRQQARADALYRRSVDSAAVGMCLINPEGGFVDVNEAVCEFFGYDAETLKSKTWQELTAEKYLQADLDNVADVLAGRIESYRMTKQYVHADGHPIWGDLSVGCVRDEDGHVEVFVSQINDITAEVQSREGLLLSEERNRVLAQGLQSELSSAAKYLQSVLPGDMTGPVSVSTRYLPSNTLGGDCFDFRWIDDDHLIVYLLDVSGHGVESALIAASVHNMLRSASFTTETMLQPDRVLATLNQQFGMDQHDGNYFTIFYGVYQRSSAMLRYANAGHPPALVFTGGSVIELASQSFPVGMFDDTPFTTAALSIPPGGQLLLYSDGAYEITLGDGGQWPLRAFVDLCTGLGGSPDWTLDDVIDNVLGNSAGGRLDDDCCLVRLTFD